MTKQDIGHMDCPFYEEKLDNHLTLVFLPKKSELKSCTVYIGQGGFLHAKEIASSKVPFGSSYYLMNLIASSSFKEELKEEGVLLSSDLDYSFVRYSLSSLNDIYAPLMKLMKRISTFSFDEKEVEAFKETEKKNDEKKKEDPIYLSKMQMLDNLYVSSPIKYGYLPSFEDGKRIHASGLRKYQENYYVPENITIFLSLDDEPGNVLSKIKEIKFAPHSMKEEKKFEYEEVYTSVNREYKEISLKTMHSYLTYGIKLPSRSIIYDNYGELTFAFYEILLESTIKKNKAFQEQLGNLRSILVSSELKEGGEDGYILLTFRTEDEISLVHFLTNYFSTLGEKVDKSDFSFFCKSMYLNAIASLALPNKACDLFSSRYPNHIPYTSLMKRVEGMSYSSYRRFLEEFKAFKKAACFVKRSEQR